MLKKAVGAYSPSGFCVFAHPSMLKKAVLAYSPSGFAVFAVRTEENLAQVPEVSTRGRNVNISIDVVQTSW